MQQGDLNSLRLLSRILNLYYVDGKSQAEIGQLLSMSTSKVNRLLVQARSQGMIEIKIRLPYQQLFDLEARLQSIFGLQEATVIPPVPLDEQGQINTLGVAAANVLLRHLRDGDVIAVGAGTGVHALVEALEVKRSYRVRVVPALGGLQRRATTDVNYLASTLAEKLGGRAYQLHAPAFVETPEHYDLLVSMGQVREVLELARQASIAVLGIGSLRYTSWVSQFHKISEEEVNRLLNECGGVADVCLRVIDLDGRPCKPEYASHVVGLTLDEVKAIPVTIGVAATTAKGNAIHAALRGGYIKVIVTDESAAEATMEFADRLSETRFGVSSSDRAQAELAGRRTITL